MPEIRVLPERVANQIAAGEVVERPAAVVKELLENSLDAGATRVVVEFRHGGKSFMAVEDDGCGMTPDQALMALEMHATSKIRTAEDLNEVRTFGFRGEAVPSIASVSRFTLRTRPAGAETGVEIFVNGGKFTHQREAVVAPGTRVEVANLFQPVPARLKFMKAENTEAAHITRLVRLYAVAQPQVGFTLLENGDEIFRSPAQASLAERVREIYGRQLADDLAPLAESERGGMRLWGLLGKPGVGRATRQEMVTIVNGRPVDSRALAYALVESYHTLLPKGRYPLAFLFLDIDPRWVDVNVHPAKREVRFRDEPGVRQFVITEVLRHLGALGATVAPPPVETSPWAAGVRSTSTTAGVWNANDATAGTAGANAPSPATPPSTPPVPPATTPATATASPFAPPPATPPHYSPDPRSPLPAPSAPVPARAAPAASFRLGWRFAGHLTGDLLLFETPAPAGGLVVMSVRAARARIQYERVLARFNSREPVSQQLLLPAPLELDPLAADVLRDGMPILRAAGFDISEFGRGLFRVHAVPDWLADAPVEARLRDIIAGLGRHTGDFQRRHMAYEFLAKQASDAATAGGAGAGTTFSADTAGALARELFLCSQPTVCPRGRPVFFEITRSELARRLGAGS
ncbi:MAG: DNA mismatch repair endonuclease MutL [Puniceicoccales bacterium]|jgi:DNA mismatch repair protein MutL|nr:DNA mismatch repair endonuclease MutL [Puniceicoccales bacterium]